MSKPTVLPAWNTGLANNTAPSGAKQTLGWTVGEAPSSASFNWYQKLVYDWVVYLSAGQFTTGSGGIAVLGTGSAPGFTGVKGTGAQFGVSGVGTSGGIGVQGSGGIGVNGIGGASFPGVVGTGGSTGTGAYGVHGIGGDQAHGVLGTAGADSGSNGFVYGVQGIGAGGVSTIPPSGGPFYNLDAGVMGTSANAYGGLFLSQTETALVARTQNPARYGMWAYHENGVAIYGQSGLGGGIGVWGDGFNGGIGVQGQATLGGFGGAFVGAQTGTVGLKALGYDNGAKFYSNAGNGAIGYAQDDAGTPSTSSIAYGLYGIGADGATDYSSSPYAAAIDPVAIAAYTRGSHGVRGASVAEIGVLGTSNTGYGIMGVVDTSSGTKDYGAWGVVGLNYSGSSTGSGAVYGRTINGTGIKGSTDNGVGVFGEANSGGTAGVFVTQPNPGSIGVSASGYSAGITASSEIGPGVIANSTNEVPLQLVITAVRPAAPAYEGGMIINDSIGRKLEWCVAADSLGDGGLWRTALDTHTAVYTAGPAILSFGATSTTQIGGGTVEFLWPGYGFVSSADEIGVLATTNPVAPHSSPGTLFVHSLVVKTDGAQDDVLTFTVRVNGVDLIGGADTLQVILPAGQNTPMQTTPTTLFTINAMDEISVSVTPGPGQTVVANKVRVSVLVTAEVSPF